MFQPPHGRGRGGGGRPKARTLCLKRTPILRSSPSRKRSSQNRQDTHARASSSGSTSTSTSSTGRSGSRLLLQGALGVGIGLGLGLGFSVGVSNMLQDDMEDLGAVGGNQERNLVSLSSSLKGNKLQSGLEKLVKKLKPDSRRQVTDVLIQLNCLTFFLQKASKGWLSAWACKHNAAIARGQLWRLFTPALLHGNLLHLLVNCYTLSHLGPSTEALFGGKRMLAVYMLSGVSGNVFSFYMNPLPALGCSGALFGLLGALGYFYYKHSNVLKREHVERPLRSLNSMLLTNMVIGLITPNIDNWAHMGGLFAGVGAVLLLGPNFKIEGTKGSKADPPVLVDKPIIRALAKKPLQLS